MDRNTVDNHAANELPVRVAPSGRSSGLWLRLEDGDLVPAGQITRIAVRHRTAGPTMSAKEAAADLARRSRHQPRFRQRNRDRRSGSTASDAAARVVWFLSVAVAGRHKVTVDGAAALEDVARTESEETARQLQQQLLLAVLADENAAPGLISCSRDTASIVVSRLESPFLGNEGPAR